MALIRCEQHAPKGRTREYVNKVHPVGYPDTAIICGCRSCTTPGLIWLEAAEEAAYKRGNRIFRGPTHAFKVRAAEMPSDLSSESLFHPAFGSMKGLIQIASGVDLTEPGGSDWGKVYD